jgi:hypothetical protein
LRGTIPDAEHPEFAIVRALVVLTSHLFTAAICRVLEYVSGICRVSEYVSGTPSRVSEYVSGTPAVSGDTGAYEAP